MNMKTTTFVFHWIITSIATLDKQLESQKTHEKETKCTDKLLHIVLKICFLPTYGRKVGLFAYFAG